ncbi:MAG TPA: nucleoside phosphorylase [Gammaproteobacteria bacterium]|nr:nucleoside phosphorylase [Gammaproteobacteria bacterium]
MKNNIRIAHINATPEDLSGNQGIGRYILIPGSDGRAKEIADHFDDLEVKTHERGIHLYLGSVSVESEKIEVASIGSGMGCPSMEIYLHELFQLGAKRFLRIGTAGSLQPWVKPGDLINVQAAVRDENTTERYLPLEFPAIASLEMTSSVLLAAEQLELFDQLHTGTVHCKSSLYAREFGIGPRKQENQQYLNLLHQAGVLASEMETAALFIQTQIYNHALQLQDESANSRVMAGAILGIVASSEEGYDADEAPIVTQQTIELALETIKILAIQELGG